MDARETITYLYEHGRITQRVHFETIISELKQRDACHDSNEAILFGIKQMLCQYDEFGTVFDECELPELAKEVLDALSEVLGERDVYKDCLEFTKKFMTDEANETIWISSGETLYEYIDTVLADDKQKELFPAVAESDCDELLPCPCCNGKAEIVRIFGRIGISCSQCFVQIRSEQICGEAGYDAIFVAWNNRKSLTP